MDVMPAYSFDVTVSTHGLLKRGITEARMLNGEDHHRIVVWADGYQEAQLIAAQMAWAVDVRELAGQPISGHAAEENGSVQCTGTYLRI
jgi:hypothetical protein